MFTPLINIFEEMQDAVTTSYMTATNQLITGFDISSQDFISYAEVDLTLKYDHKYVNALSNSKRALDCQLDSLLVSFGYYPISQKEYWNFPKKLDFIKELGIIAPRILRKINKQRNLLEHQFVNPERETVEDFLDISMLFIASTDKYTLQFKTGINYKNEVLDKAYFLKNIYNEQKFTIDIKDYKNRMEIGKEDPLETHTILVSDPLYKDLLKFYLRDERLKTVTVKP